MALPQPAHQAVQHRTLTYGMIQVRKLQQQLRDLPPALTMWLSLTEAPVRLTGLPRLAHPEAQQLQLHRWMKTAAMEMEPQQQRLPVEPLHTPTSGMIQIHRALQQRQDCQLQLTVLRLQTLRAATPIAQ